MSNTTAPKPAKGRPPGTTTEGQQSKYTAFRCPLDILALAKAEAKKQRRSVSNWIITLIEAATKNQG